MVMVLQVNAPNMMQFPGRYKVLHHVKLGALYIDLQKIDFRINKSG
jgi:hypothetical protein